MYKWFLSLKQRDGSFLVSHEAEIDVRGLYCLLVTATVLNLLTPELLEGVPGFIAVCQSFEGGPPLVATRFEWCRHPKSS
jgi:protein farnesyltransferase subunit beta